MAAIGVLLQLALDDGGTAGVSPSPPSSLPADSNSHGRSRDGGVERIFDVERLGLATYFLALVYVSLALYAANQIRKLRRVMPGGGGSSGGGGGMDTQRLFQYALMAHVSIRALAFGVLAAFSIGGNEMWYPLQAILFTLPEFTMISVYLLLFMLWLDCFTFAHEQLMFSSRRRFRRRLLVAFGLLSGLIYGGVVAAYVLLCVRTEVVDDSVVQAVLWTTCIGCLALPALMLGVSAYFNLLLLSGFEYGSQMARIRVKQASEAMGVWTLGRIARGILLLLSIVYEWQTRLNSNYLSMVIVAALAVAEVAPLLFVLNFKWIALLASGDGELEPSASPYLDVTSPLATSPLLTSTSSDALSLQEAGFQAAASSSIGSVSVVDSMLPLANGPPAAQAHFVPFAALRFLPPSPAADSLLQHLYHSSEERRPAGFTALHRAQLKSGGPLLVVQSYSFPADGSDQSALLADMTADVAEGGTMPHAHLVPFRGVSLREPAGATLYVLSEFMPLGSLQLQLHHPPSDSSPLFAPGPLPARTVLRLSREIALGLGFAHARGVVHGSVKSSVVLLDSAGHARVGDAALRKLKAYAELVHVARLSHPAYLAPELLAGTHMQSAASDVYAWAVVAWEAATRRVPWEGLDLSAIYAAVVQRRQHLPLPAANGSKDSAGLPAAFWRLLVACWSLQPSARPTMAQISAQMQAMQAEVEATASYASNGRK